MNPVLLRFLCVAAFMAAGLTVVLSGEEARPKNDNKSPDPVGEVRPLLAKYCVSCHGEKPRAGLDLRSPTDPVKVSLLTVSNPSAVTRSTGTFKPYVVFRI
jgi:hypothetical protein